MSSYVLPTPPGYDPRCAALVAHTAAQLDQLLAALAERVRGASVAELEWQLQPGVNTTGMLLAHLAVVEVYWVQVVCSDIASDEQADAVLQSVIGLGLADDGIPLPPSGRHPGTLAGWSAADYLDRLERARASTHRALWEWDDESLAATWTFEGREVSRAGVLCHLVEHFAHHSGQIALLASLRERVEG